jgi:branched-chain amino acid transport system ATP-binding protein
MLAVRNITKAFGGLTAVDQVNLTVQEREIFSIIGPNGAGKTTLFNLMTGLYRPDSGEILFRGRNIAGFRPDRVAAQGIGRTFQNIRLFGAMTVGEPGSSRRVARNIAASAAGSGVPHG